MNHLKTEVLIRIITILVEDLGGKASISIPRINSVVGSPKVLVIDADKKTDTFKLVVANHVETNN